MATTTDYFTTKTVNGQNVNYAFEVVNMQQMISDVNDLSSINNTLNNDVTRINTTITDTSSNLNSVINSLISYSVGGSLATLNTDLAPLVNQ